MSSLRVSVPWVALCLFGCSLEHPTTITPADSGMDVVVDVSEVAACGQLGQSCCPADGATACASGLTCTAGTCVMGSVCTRPSEVDCGGTCVNTMSSTAHCGRCGNACRTAPNSTVTCAMGACRSACADGFGDCNSDPSDGCEVNLRIDGSNCGVCNNPCSVTNGRASCAMGRCAVGSCDANFADCDMTYGNGCETDTRTSLTNCGRCGGTCASGANSTASCVMATCGLSCSAGFGDCDATAANGCETPTATSVMHCGRCGNACPTGVGGTPTCTAGACGFVCAMGSGDCNGTVADGCETNTTTSTANCGRCGVVCSFANATATCAAGVCAMGACAAGFANCNGMASDGCETNINTSIAHCGVCRAACATTTNGTSVCTSGICGVLCNTGFAPVGLNCVAVSAPRPVFPMSTSTVTSRRPTFRWVLGPEMDGAQLEICPDRACSTRTATLAVVGSTATLITDLPAGTYFWRLFGRLGVTTSTASSPVWEFTVGTRSATASSAYGATSDVNGDGLADVIVGARGVNRAFVYFGTRSVPPTTASQTLDGAADSNFGVNVAAAGDVNGDGFGDVIVGADNAASANVFYGSAAGLLVGSPTRLAGGAGSSFGFAVTGIGDFNGDGYGDVAVGAYRTNTVFVFQGGASGVATSASLTIASPSADAGAQFGFSLGTAGDVNADGFADLVVGSFSTATNNAWIFHGAAMPSRLPTSALGPGLNSFGISVGGAGDVNGDGFSDVLVSALSSQVLLFRGSASGITLPGQVITTPGDNGFGVKVTSLGDLNSDGFSDVGVGTFTDSVFVYHGSLSGLSASSVPSLVLRSTPMSGFGVCLTGGGDTNGDGFSDLIVGSYRSGSAAIYRGSSTGAVLAPAATFLGPTGSFFGIYVASNDRRRGARNLALR